MKTLTKEQRQNFEMLLVKAVDDVLTKSEKIEFDAFVQNFEECRDEWREHQKLKEVTNAMKLKNPSSEIWDGYWMGIYNRIERGIAWISLSVGSIILITYTLFQFVKAAIQGIEKHPVIITAVLLVLLGFTILMVSIIREKISMRKTDPYKEVKR